MATARYRGAALPRRLPRPLRSEIRRLAAEAARVVAARVDARQRERLALHALDLLEAGHSLDRVAAELADA